MGFQNMPTAQMLETEDERQEDKQALRPAHLPRFRPEFCRALPHPSPALAGEALRTLWPWTKLHPVVDHNRVHHLTACSAPPLLVRTRSRLSHRREQREGPRRHGRCSPVGAAASTTGAEGRGCGPPAANAIKRGWTLPGCLRPLLQQQYYVLLGMIPQPPNPAVACKPRSLRRAGAGHGREI